MQAPSEATQEAVVRETVESLARAVTERLKGVGFDAQGHRVTVATDDAMYRGKARYGVEAVWITDGVRPYYVETLVRHGAAGDGRAIFVALPQRFDGLPPKLTAGPTRVATIADCAAFLAEFDSLQAGIAVMEHAQALPAVAVMRRPDAADSLNDAFVRATALQARLGQRSGTAAPREVA